MMRRSGYFDDDSNTHNTHNTHGDQSKPTTIQERVEAYKKRLWAGTFHSFSSAIIRRYGDDMLRNKRVVSSTEQRAMLSEIVSRILSGLRFKAFTKEEHPEETEIIAEALAKAKEEVR